MHLTTELTGEDSINRVRGRVSRWGGNGDRAVGRLFSAKSRLKETLNSVGRLRQSSGLEMVSEARNRSEF